MEEAIDVSEVHKQRIKQSFNDIEIDRKDLEAAERAIRGELIDRWDELTLFEQTDGFPVDKMDVLVQDISRKLKLSGSQHEELLDTFRPMVHAKAKSKLISTFSLRKDEINTMYGYISMMKSGQSEVNVAVALYSLDFQFSKRKYEVVRQRQVEHQAWFLFIPLGTYYTTEEYSEVVEERVKLGSEDVKKIKDSYVAYRAVESLKQKLGPPDYSNQQVLPSF
eukprot:CAMPEP_0117754142 /NCGR_PEP_ID=MMETSP0947-20121206/12655_1 /TAXON_ID=44440 /ORGANISM="Chattonella subsalsa, Strain CCMP2191" /LENGTH=221 /DNA_ID=CAMNT_0005573179 /DNA_START=250 /DNA_END=915 /DNA_ORIENTATION=+